MQINRIRLRNFRQHEDTDLVLGAGSMPLDVLAQRVEQWIATQRSAKTTTASQS